MLLLFYYKNKQHWQEESRHPAILKYIANLWIISQKSKEQKKKKMIIISHIELFSGILIEFDNKILLLYISITKIFLPKISENTEMFLPKTSENTEIFLLSTHLFKQTIHGYLLLNKVIVTVVNNAICRYHN